LQSGNLLGKSSLQKPRKKLKFETLLQTNWTVQFFLASTSLNNSRTPSIVWSCACGRTWAEIRKTQKKCLNTYGHDMVTMAFCPNRFDQLRRSSGTPDGKIMKQVQKWQYQFVLKTRIREKHDISIWRHRPWRLICIHMIHRVHLRHAFLLQFLLMWVATKHDMPNCKHVALGATIHPIGVYLHVFSAWRFYIHHICGCIACFFQQHVYELVVFFCIVPSRWEIVCFCNICFDKVNTCNGWQESHCNHCKCATRNHLCHLCQRVTLHIWRHCFPQLVFWSHRDDSKFRETPVFGLIN
jgi:hypothetical protein